MLRRILKALIWTLAGFAGLTVAWLALALILSRFDEAPIPEVEAALADAARPVDWSEANGYVWAASLQAPLNVRPTDYAKTLLTATAAPDRLAVDEGAEARFSELRCKRDLGGVNCLAWYGARKARIEALLPEFNTTDQRYSQLLLTPNYEEPASGSEFAFGALLSVLGSGERQIMRLGLLAQAGEADRALSGLLQKVQVERRALARARSITSKMVWASCLQRSLLAIADLVEIHPRLASQLSDPPALRDTLSPAELSLLAPVQAEIVFAHRSVHELVRPGSKQTATGAPRRLVDDFASYLVRPSQTVNAIARRGLEGVTVCEGPTPTLLRRIDELRKTRRPFSWARTLLWPNNVGGDLLFELYWIDVASYCGQLADLEAIRRLVLAQALLVSDARASLPGALRNPFTDQAFERTGASGDLRYDPANKSELPSPIVVRIATLR